MWPNSPRKICLHAFDSKIKFHFSLNNFLGGLILLFPFSRLHFSINSSNFAFRDISPDLWDYNASCHKFCMNQWRFLLSWKAVKSLDRLTSAQCWDWQIKYFIWKTLKVFDISISMRRKLAAWRIKSWQFVTRSYLCWKLGVGSFKTFEYLSEKVSYSCSYTFDGSTNFRQ